MKKIKSMTTTPTVVDIENIEPLETSVSSELKKANVIKKQRRKKGIGKKS